ncbi:MAG: HAD-IB family hydrolase [Micrococcales bacterium]|nr:HAD-IB family hydrolase [Micrococcales bacterium]
MSQAQLPTPAGHGQQVAAFFDVDNTVLRGASLFHLGVALKQRGVISLRDVARFFRINLRYVLFGESEAGVEATKTKSLEAIAGKPVTVMESVAEHVWDEVLSARIFPGAKDLIDKHLALGHEVWLISASPAEVVETIADRIGATGARGTIGERIDGRYTGRLVGGLLHGPAKATAVEELAAERGLDLAASFAYGDSANDIPMLSLVGSPCGINPDRRLRRYCARSAWPVREFRARRRAVRRSVRTVYSMGTVWAFWLVTRQIWRRLGRLWSGR